MDNVKELHRQAEEVKERLKRDILELRDLVKRVETSIGENKLEADDLMNRTERRIEETVSDIDTRFDKVISAITPDANRRIVSRRLNYTDFTAIEIDCSFEIEIIQSNSYQVTIGGNELLIDYVDVSKSGNTLKLTLKPHRFDIRPALQARIEMPSLSKMRMGATSKGTVRGFDSQDNLRIRLSGCSILETDIIAGTLACEVSGASRLLGKMEIGDAEFTISGSSRVELAGSAKDIVLNAWGASHAAFEGFVSNNMAVHLNGASEATVNAMGKLDIDINSGSRLIYADSPTIRNISVTGASSLHHR
jgi:hypothetical protein